MKTWGLFSSTYFFFLSLLDHRTNVGASINTEFRALSNMTVSARKCLWATPLSRTHKLYCAQLQICKNSSYYTFSLLLSNLINVIYKRVIYLPSLRHRHPLLSRNTSMSHTVTLGDMFLHAAVWQHKIISFVLFLTIPYYLSKRGQMTLWCVYYEYCHHLSEIMSKLCL